jgi:nicotinamide riboside transporter PnuC
MLEFFNTYRGDFQQISSIALALAIWRWGGGPERWLIGLFIATMVMPIYLFQIFALGEPATGPNAWLYSAFDLVAAAGFTLVALGANRNYPLWIAGLQLVVVGTHAVKGLVDDISLFAQVILIVGPAYCQLTLILIGFLRHVRRERRFGSYRDWRAAHERLPLLQT